MKSDNSSEEKLRLLQTEDIPAIFQLSTAAGWNQTEADWRMLLQLAPEGCLAIEVNGQIAATTTLVCYERGLAWVGMVLTKQEYRRRGLARRLLAAALEQADNLEIETTKLDATDQGKSLYEEFGFRAEQSVERWTRPGTKSSESNAIPELHAGICPKTEVWRRSDTLVFGADRLHLLQQLAERNEPMELSQSYLFARPGRVTAHLGPCVCQDPETARRLIQERVRNTSCGWSWDLFPKNQAAVALARDLGFTPQRHLVRMARGKTLQQNENAIYAIAGFELG